MNRKRRSNILYRLRKKGYRANTKEKVVFLNQEQRSDHVIQINRLRSEFGFIVQLEF